ncbi:hypothetical protein ScPMuIL_007689 [Solemya velum]
MYRKRWERTVVKHKSETSVGDTPRTKTRKLLKVFSTKTVRKTLLFHHALLEQIKHSCKEKSKSKPMASILAGNILKKYRLTTLARNEVGIGNTRGSFEKKGSLSKRLAHRIQMFYERDDISRQTTGQKQTVTRRKVKKQKRLLCDTLENLHNKYVAENINNNLSYATFCRLRPFWVVIPTEKERDTCACKLCENVKYMADALHKAKAIKTSKMKILVQQVVCSETKQACMYGECSVCKQKSIPTECRDKDADISWMHWKNVKEDRTLKGGEKKVTLTVKSEESGTIGELAEKLTEQTRKYSKHSYNITNQHKHYKFVKENLDATECFIHVDFAENYVGKMSTEIQAMHFGASKPQITLHTGYYSIGDKPGLVSFSGVSDSLQHGPAAIWAYLKPILVEIKRSNPKVEYIHFYSDGPTPQYRQKGNFYLFATEIYDFGFTGASWNFHEAGHGKGIPDGIGGSLKRVADRCVRQGTDILDAKTFVNTLREELTSVELFLVHDTDILEMEDKLKARTLKTVPGTLRLHQVTTTAPGQIKFRDVSCTCTEHVCDGHTLRDFSFTEIQTVDTSQQQNASGIKVDESNEGSKVRPRGRKKAVKQKKEKPVGTKKAKPKVFKDHSITVEDEGTVSTNEYQNLLQVFMRCNTFVELQSACEKVTTTNLVGKSRFICEEGLTVDGHAIDMYPADVPEETVRYPVSVRADGDCLAATGSVFAFGQDDRPDEIRARVVIELAMNKEFYLNEDNLRQGLTEPRPKGHTIKAFTMYSELYVPGTRLDREVIETIYEHEALQIAKPRSYMGIWQLCGLSSVLQIPIYSVYPCLGDPVVRRDLHRLIEPRQKSNTDTAVVMWTSTRTDMVDSNWLPNHFVPVLQIDRSRLIEHVSQTVSEEMMDNTCVCEEKMDNTCVSEEIMDSAGVSEERLDSVHVSERLDSARVSEEIMESVRVSEEKLDSVHVSERLDSARVSEEIIESACVSEEKLDSVRVGEKLDSVCVSEETQDSASVSERLDSACVSEETLDSAGVSERLESAGVSERLDSARVSEEIMESVHVSEEKLDSACVSEEKLDSACVSEEKLDSACVSEEKLDSACVSEKLDSACVHEMMGKYVVVMYDGVPYPGYILDDGFDEVYVECMHPVRNKTNCFSWPKNRKDKCWYKHENIVAVIPEPAKIERHHSHYQVKESLWKDEDSRGFDPLKFKKANQAASPDIFKTDKGSSAVSSTTNKAADLEFYYDSPKKKEKTIPKYDVTEEQLMNDIEKEFGDIF